MPQYRRTHLKDLDPVLRVAWEAAQASDPSLSSPCFAWQFATAVSEERPDVELVVIEDGGRPIGLFPFQRRRWGAARPVGGVMSDFHGVVVAPEADWNATDLLKSARVRAWQFDHLLACQKPWEHWHAATSGSPGIRLGGGYEAYVAERRMAGSKQIQKAEAMARKLEREVGPLRFEARSTDKSAFATLLTWKSAQFRHSGAPDLFAMRWSVGVLERIWQQSGAMFAGMFSTLHAGDRLVAAHMGMRSPTVWHYWFPSYDHEVSACSPGIVLLHQMVKAAPGMGVTLIDLGKGDSFYKDRFANCETLIAEGRAEVRSLASLWHGLLKQGEAMARANRFAMPAGIPMRLARRIEYRRRIL